jgi:ATP-binding cassette subfamily C protein CydC
MGIAVLLGFATIASSVGLLAASAYIISRAALQPSIAELQVAIVGVRTFGITRGLFRYLERLVSHNVAFQLLARLRVWFYRRLEPLAPARTMHVQSGDLLSRIVADIETLEGFFIRVVSPPLIALCIGGLMWVLLSTFDTRLAWALLVFLILAGITPTWARHLSRGSGARMIQHRGELSAALVDSVQGCGDLLAYNSDGRQRARAAFLSERLTDAQFSLASTRGLSSALQDLAMNAAVVALLLIGIPLVGSGRVDGVYLALIVMAAMASFEAITPLQRTILEMDTFLSAARRLYEIVDGEPAVHDPPEASPTTHDSTLVVRDLTFRYESEPGPALQSISFHLHQGEHLAIVGPSGAGKSSLVNLLLRFWEFERGEILLGGYDIRQYRQRDLWKVVGVVSQTSHLFNGTIRENLLMAMPAASERDLIQVARRARLYDFIQSLPGGFDTWIGEGGLRLSAGERQRLVIARTLLQDAPLLILDEPTANLDALTEIEIFESLLVLMERRSTLLITHRLIGLGDMDNILVLQDGQIIQRGRHEELAHQPGLYQDMWVQQAQDHTIEILR